MPWRKLGRIYTPDGQRGWAQSHASVPIADHVSENRYRIYFTARDGGNRSHVGWCEININNPEKILAESEDPVLAPGKLGAFDMDGVMASTLVRFGEERRLYYIGWNRACGVSDRASEPCVVKAAFATRGGGGTPRGVLRRTWWTNDCHRRW